MTRPFEDLTPDRVLTAVEASGIPCTGLCYQLNSMENRVYEVERRDKSRVIVKFYRPGRWSREAIAEEHRFLAEARDLELPVVCPLPFPDGDTIHAASGFFTALFPKVGGRVPDESTDDELVRLGMMLARLHNLGAARAVTHRRRFDPEALGTESLEFLEAEKLVPGNLGKRFSRAGRTVVDAARALWGDVPVHRIHGDCHRGNLLRRDSAFFLLDFDDFGMGPAVQDVWMLVPGSDPEAVRQRDVLLEGYAKMREFPRWSLRLVEPLRALRYLWFPTWIARHREDPAFQKRFPEFGGERYWAREVHDLEEQAAVVGEMAADAAAGGVPDDVGNR